MLQVLGRGGAGCFRHGVGAVESSSGRLRCWIHNLLRRAMWLALLLGALPSALHAEKPAVGTTRRDAREDAIRLLPLNKLDARQRAKIEGVVRNTSIYRRMPTQVFECDPAFYLFLVEHPDLVVNIWEVLGISDVALDRTSPKKFQADDGAGTLGTVEYVFQSPEMHLMYCEGSYDGVLFAKPVRGKCVMMLRTEYSREADGKYYVTCRMDSFVEVDNVSVELLAKTIQPLVGPIADHNFRETAAFVSSLHRAAQVNHAGVRKLAKKLTNVEERVRNQFTELSAQLAVRASLAKTEEDEASATVIRAPNIARSTDLVPPPQKQQR
jgi:hypothetical protein